jgi:hypothetical protein
MVENSKEVQEGTKEEIKEEIKEEFKEEEEEEQKMEVSKEEPKELKEESTPETAPTAPQNVLTQEDVQREVARLLEKNKKAEQAAKELHSAKIAKLKELGITQNVDAIANTYSDVDTLESNIRAVRANILRDGEGGNVKDNSSLTFDQKLQQTMQDFRAGKFWNKK